MSAACTHLVANTPTGDKYTFALANNIPVVTVKWLRTCVSEGRYGAHAIEYGRYLSH
jgi:hypothetical protein